MQEGLFLTVEGVDGVGKGTQMEFIKSYLKENSIDFISIREPGGTKIGEAIRKILLNPDNQDMIAETELLLFNAARAQLVSEVIKPNLAAGKWVISDRFYDSTLAYQVAGRGLDARASQEIIDFACQGLEPDLTIYLDLDIETSLKRLEARNESKDRLESLDIDFKKRVRNKYLDLAQAKDRIKVISAAATVPEVSNEIKKILDVLIKANKEA